MSDNVIRASHGERQTGSGLYDRLPERASWTESEVRERADGTQYRVTRWASRWAGTFAHGEWTEDASWTPSESAFDTMLRDMQRAKAAA